MQPEQRVLLLMLDTVDFVAAFLGAMKIGAVPVPVNTLLKPHDYAFFLRDSRARVAVVSDALRATLEAALADRPSTLAHVVLGASAMGLGGGLVMVLFFSVWARAFGRRHLGRIQGMAQAMTVLASALGPLLLAWCVDRTGSYAVMFRILAAGVALTALVAWMTPMPKSTRRP